MWLKLFTTYGNLMIYLTNLWFNFDDTSGRSIRRTVRFVLFLKGLLLLSLHSTLGFRNYTLRPHTDR